MKYSQKLRFGVIGAGGIADRRTMPGIINSRHAALSAVMNPKLGDARRLKDKYGALRAYDDAFALAQDKTVDAVYIASPVKEHLAQALIVADCGKPLLIEKPLALTSGDGQKIVDAFAGKQLPLAAGLMMRFGAHTRRMKERLKAGDIGPLVSAYARFSCWYPDIPGAWRQRPETGGGGALMDMGVHVIDLIAWMTGSPVKQVAAMTDTQTFSYPVEDAACVLMRLENGALCALQSHFNIPDEGADWRLDLFGTRGSLLGPGILGQVDGGRLEMLSLKETGGYDSRQDGERQAFTQLPADFGDLYAREIDSFCKSILKGLSLEAPAQAALDAQRVVEAAYQSQNSGVFVAV
ncbi:MAG: Gfo/Idh/MocA family oxidoreductase [Eubacteriales bacterium]|nr:Gfo/Idh/MocA family oxidoreductase [Eubacteriales bacterium]